MLGIVLVVGLVIWGFWMLGRFYIGGAPVISRTKGHERKRLSFWNGLKRLFRLWKNKLRVWLFLWKNRSTPVGIYFLVEEKCRMGPWHKREGETPREFLGRLKGYAAGDEPLSEALAGLIPAVDVALYSGRGGKTAQIPQARLIRRRIGGTVRRQFFRNLKQSVLLKVRRTA